MARATTPLNDTQIKNSKPKDKEYTLADGQGLQLLIKPNGTKLWEFRFKSPTTLKRRKTSIGTYPSVKLAQARGTKQEYLELISQGIDPIENKQKEEQEKKEKEENKKYTVEFVANKYFDFIQHNNNLADGTITLSKNRLANHYYKYLPKKESTPIADISYKDTIKILDKLEVSKKYETLHRVKSLIINVFDYAFTEDMIQDTEVSGKLKLKGFKRNTERRNNPTLTKKEDIAKLYKSMKYYEHSLKVRYLLLFSIHTAQRQGSIITARWEDIDFGTKMWTIPKENMKMKKDHIVPLTDIVISYLKELYNITGDDIYLFPNSQLKKTRNKHPHMSNNTVTSALRAMGYSKEEQTAHGLRAMFKTVCKEHQEEHKLNNEFVERVLAHQIGNDVERAYNRSSNIEDMRKVLNWWSEWLEKSEDTK